MHLKRVGGMVAVVFVALLMGIGIQLTQEFRFYALESNHLFLFDADHMANKVAQPGGIALLMAFLPYTIHADTLCGCVHGGGIVFAHGVGSL